MPKSKGFLHYYLLTNIFYIYMQGTIKKLTDKNFGFIAQEGGAKDLFFHASNLEGVDFSELREGDAVTFEVGETPKGPAATQVRKA